MVLPLVRKSLFKLSRRQNLVGLLQDLDFQVPRYVGAEGWIVEQPLRKPLQWSKWFGSRRHGIDAETEATHHFNPTLVTVVDGVIIALVWECGGSRHVAFFFRLDAHAEATRIHQLQKATRWAKEKVSSADVVVFAGDRNFVRSDSERWSSASSVWRPSLRMNATWDEWLSSMRWCSLNSHGDVSMPTPLIMPHGSMRSLMWWVQTIIFILQLEYDSLPVGGDDLPHPRTSDHWPVGLRWSGAKKKRKPPDSSDNIVHRPIPPWLLDNAEFQRVVDECFDLWFARRDSGLAGLSSFVGTIYNCATKFLSTHVIVATTARQRLALTAMRSLERHTIDERRLSRRS